ncbi:MAG: hypothetical protein M3004_02655, partial [Bacteroidota bacterium]|nr:hypothetical protein [Bacteroidota bacterium]
MMGKLLLQFYRKINVIVYCIPAIFFCTPIVAQRCNTYQYQKTVSGNSQNNLIAAKTSSITRDTLANEVITIPVVIHVLYNKATENISDAQILSQIKALNNDYSKLNTDAANVPRAFASLAADTRIAFCIAKTDPSGKLTTGIIHKYTPVQSWTADDGMKFTAQGGDNAWDSKRYLNIWVCNLFGRSLGYSSLPGSQTDKDGVVIQY